MAPIQLIIGSLWFYAQPTPDFFADHVTVDLRLNEPIKLENPTKYESLIWNYPSHLKLEFYDQENSKQPYATITGPKQTVYQTMLTGFKKGYDSTITRKVLPKYADGTFFQSDMAYMKAVPI